MRIQWKIIRAAAFPYGLGAFKLMFGKIKAPGSRSHELRELTIPAALAKYRAIEPDLPTMMIKFQTKHWLAIAPTH